MAKKTKVKTASMSSVRSNTRRSSRGTTNNREKKLCYAIIALAVLLVGSIGVAVAAFSTDLYIRGTATVRSTVWDVHFENLQSVDTTGSFAREITAPTIQTSADGNAMAAIATYEVELKEPGDSVEYTFDVVNAGDMDAEITAVVMNTGTALACSSAAGQTAADKVCSKLNYTLTYADGTPVVVGDTLENATTSNNSRTMKLKLEFDESATTADLPDKDVVISGLAVIITYGQAN